MATKVKYSGVPVNDLIVPALSIGQAEDFDALISAIAPLTEPAAESRTAYAKRLLPLVAAAVRRNYPEMTDAQVADDLDFDSFNLAVKAALAISDANAPAKTRGEQ
jgi:hypothetical protein